MRFLKCWEHCWKAQGFFSLTRNSYFPRTKLHLQELSFDLSVIALKKLDCKIVEFMIHEVLGLLKSLQEATWKKKRFVVRRKSFYAKLVAQFLELSLNFGKIIEQGLTFVNLLELTELETQLLKYPTQFHCHRVSNKLGMLQKLFENLGFAKKSGTGSCLFKKQNVSHNTSRKQQSKTMPILKSYLRKRYDETIWKTTEIRSRKVNR